MKVIAQFPKADPSPLPRTKMVMALGYGDPDTEPGKTVPIVIDLFELTCEYLTYEPRSNFRHSDLWSVKNGFGAVTSFYHDIPFEYVKGIQVEESGVTLNEKINWLIGDTTDGGKPERPMWWAWGKDGSTKVLRCGTSSFSGNPVLIETDAAGKPIIEVYHTAYPGRNDVEPVPFYRVAGLPAAEMGNANPAETPYWIQRCSQGIWDKNLKKDTIDWYPKGGTIYYPFFSYADFPTNTGSPDMLMPVKMCREYKP